MSGGYNLCGALYLIKPVLSITNSFFTRACMRVVYINVIEHILNKYAFNVKLSNVSIAKTLCTSLRIENIKMIQLQNVYITGSLRVPVMEIVQSELVVKGELRVSKNSGGIISYQSSTLIFQSNSHIRIMDNQIENSQTIKTLHIYGTPFYATNCNIQIEDNARVDIGKNMAAMSGGMTLVDSQVLMYGHSMLNFFENVGSNGGGLGLYGSSIVFFKSSAKVIFTENTARQSGGGVFIDDRKYLGTASNTFINSFLRLYIYSNNTPTIEFKNNTANLAGSALYGGWIDWIAYLKNNEPIYTLEFVHSCDNCSIPDNFSQYFNFHTAADSNHPNDHSLVSSNPIRVCVCHNSLPQCSVTNKRVSVYIGQAFTVDVAAVGQRFGTAPAIVQAQFRSRTVDEETVLSSATLGEGESAQIVTKYCTSLTYTIITSNVEETLLLTTDTSHTPTVDSHLQNEFPHYALLYEVFSITVHLKNCSLGFYYSGQTKKCECDPIFKYFGIQCDTQSLNITKPAQMWVNATFSHLRSTQTSGVIVHEHCPYDYCGSITDTVTLNLSLPDSQCNYNRSGILCGTCHIGLSHVFGSSNCKSCSSLWLLLLVPLFCFAGIVLITVLIRLDLTVAIGTINGLIFYANIIQANRATFFPPDKSSTFLSIFIAWINLDVGIEACFYNGLNAYAQTWLQLLFPLYIWMIVIAIIITSRYSTTAARLSGTNAVQVLATLFLLSYTKLLRFVVTALSLTVLNYPNGFVQKVWLYDGNVEYLRGRHIPLFLMALVILILLSFPYTTVLLFIQCLQKCPNYSFLFWVRKLKPLFDAYTGPYKVNHRYWTGILLLIRVILLLVFSLNTFGDPEINLFAILTTTTVLLGYLSQIGGVYESKLINLIEVSFLINLSISSAATLLYSTTDGSQGSIIVILSTSFAFTIFAIVVICHGLVALIPNRKKTLIKFWIKSKFQPVQMAMERVVPIPTETVTSHATHSVIELREPLLKED